MQERIGYCGLDCAACDAYLATIRNDQALRERTAKLWAELNQAPIQPEHINCLGCRGDGVKTVFCEQLCAIRRCALQRGGPPAAAVRSWRAAKRWGRSQKITLPPWKTYKKGDERGGVQSRLGSEQHPKAQKNFAYRLSRRILYF